MAERYVTIAELDNLQVSDFTKMNIKRIILNIKHDLITTYDVNAGKDENEEFETFLTFAEYHSIIAQKMNTYKDRYKDVLNTYDIESKYVADDDFIMSINLYFLKENFKVTIDNTIMPKKDK